MASAWITRRDGKSGVRHRVEYRLGGRDAPTRYAGSFKVRREAELRLRWIRDHLAQRIVPGLHTLEVRTAPTLAEAAETLARFTR